MRLDHSVVVQVPVRVDEQISRLADAVGSNGRDDLVAGFVIIADPAVSLQGLREGALAAADDDFAALEADSAAPLYGPADETYRPGEEDCYEEVVDHEAEGAADDEAACFG